VDRDHWPCIRGRAFVFSIGLLISVWQIDTLILSIPKMTSIPRPSQETVHNLVNGKVAIVTGAARGIGFATASRLAQNGAHVVLVDVREDDLRTACGKIGPQSTYKVCDVSDWNQQVELFEDVVKTIGPIYLLVCNAAINPEIALLQTSDTQKHAQMNSQVRYNYLADERDQQNPDTLQRPPTELLDINLNSVIFGLKLGIHHLKHGRIVVVGSAGSYVPIPSQPLYSASKHAVLGLVRSTALMPEVARSGVSISWIAPWLTLTSMVEGLEATTNGSLTSSPDDVAWAIIAACVAEVPNGKGYWVQGSAISEVEGDYGELAGRLISPENRF
jgi:NAD(P)-dependent dehydrogenase (short-subunit alcohol dehydrogenase family)